MLDWNSCQICYLLEIKMFCKQPKRLPKTDQDERSEARRSEELQVPWSNHLHRRIKIRDSFQDSPDNSSSF